VSKHRVCRKPLPVNSCPSRPRPPAPVADSVAVDWRVPSPTPRRPPSSGLARLQLATGRPPGDLRPIAAPAGRAAATQPGRPHEGKRDARALPPWAFRLARAVMPGHPPAHPPAAPGAPPQSASQPGAAGPVASRLTIYSPTPLGPEKAQQALKSPKTFPGDAVYYVRGTCTVSFPYQVGLF
jgi:hypothetical protein